MVTVMLMSVVLIAGLCVLAYTLAVYALPFMLGLTAAQFAYQTGSSLIGAGLVGLVAAGVAFGVLALLFDTLRSPILRLIVALIFAAPAAVAGYALVHHQGIRTVRNLAANLLHHRRRVRRHFRLDAAGGTVARWRCPRSIARQYDFSGIRSCAACHFTSELRAIFCLVIPMSRLARSER